MKISFMFEVNVGVVAQSCLGALTFALKDRYSQRYVLQIADSLKMNNLLVADLRRRCRW